MTTKSIPLDKLRLDGDTQPRAVIDQDAVDEYAARYTVKPQTMPAVTVFFDGVDYWLADGFHRWHAARKANLTKIKCNVHQGTQEFAQWFAVAANKAHGLHRSTADKEKAIKAALRHPKGLKMSDRKLAEYVGVSDKTVAKYRAELEGRSEIPNTETRTDTTGREQPARKPRDPPEPEGLSPCPKCGNEDFFEDGTCAVCISGADPGEDTDVKPEPLSTDPATILKCDIRDVVESWMKNVKEANLMVAAAVLDNCAEELRNEQ